MNKKQCILLRTSGSIVQKNINSELNINEINIGQIKNLFKKTLEERLKESSRILSKYSNRVPIIVERVQNCNNIANIDRNKFLVPGDLSMGQFLYVIRKRIKLDSYTAIYLFVNDTVLIPSSDLMSSIYEKYHSDDKFLYISYAGENTFG